MRRRRLAPSGVFYYLTAEARRATGSSERITHRSRPECARTAQQSAVCGWSSVCSYKCCTAEFGCARRKCACDRRRCVRTKAARQVPMHSSLRRTARHPAQPMSTPSPVLHNHRPKPARAAGRDGDDGDVGANLTDGVLTRPLLCRHTQCRPPAASTHRSAARCARCVTPAHVAHDRRHFGAAMARRLGSTSRRLDNSTT